MYIPFFVIAVTGFSPVRPYPINSGCTLFTIREIAICNFLLNSNLVTHEKRQSKDCTFFLVEATEIPLLGKMST